MAMVCPNCNDTFDQLLDCPDCGVRLRIDQRDQRLSEEVDSQPTWQQKPLGRIIIGILLAQGLALGMRMTIDAGILGAQQQHSGAVWSTLIGLVVVQFLQAVGLLIAGALAGAGQAKGFLLGAVVGLVNSLIHTGLQLSSGQPITEMVLLGQPLLHVFFGAAGGLIGSLIWRPLPLFQLAQPLERKKNKTPGPKKPHYFAGPIAWVRVLLGSVIAAAGVVFATLILELVLDYSYGELHISSHLQSQLVSWEIAGVAVLLGAGYAGYNTFNGLKQGMCVGVLAGLSVGALRLSDRAFQMEEIGWTVMFVLGVGLVGGWFGGRLFPPVTAERRRVSSPV